MYDFYRNLTRLCYERGLSVTTLLRNMGLSTSKATAWKHGSIPKVAVINLLAEELGVDPSELFRMDTEDPNPEINHMMINRIVKQCKAEIYSELLEKEKAASQETDDFQRMFKSLTDDQKKMIVANMQAFAALNRESESSAQE